MGNRLKITPAALRDLQTGISYYNSKAGGLGRRFERFVHDAFTRIEAMRTLSLF